MRNGDASRRHGLSHRGFGQSGFGYLLVLFALAAMGLLLAGAGEIWHTVAMREKEAELLFVGNQFRQAITSYHGSAVDDSKQYPLRLEDLLEDRRFPAPRRHLRKLYADPMTGNADWGLVMAGDRIVGVYSLHRATPFKTAFHGRDAAFAGASSYDQWVFGPDNAATAPAAPAAPGNAGNAGNAP